jgi:hypothetical protein
LVPPRAAPFAAWLGVTELDNRDHRDIGLVLKSEAQ